MSYLKSLLTESDKGTSLVEYALLVALVAVISVPAVSMAGHNTRDTFQTVGDTLAMADEGDSADQGEDDQAEDDSTDQQDDTQDQGSDTDQDDSANGSDDSNSSDDSDSSGSSGDNNDKSCDNGNNGHNGNCDNQKNCNNQNVGNNGQNCDEDEDSDVDDSPETTDVTVSEATSEFSSWESTKHGGEGEWVASFDFANDSTGDRYLKLEVVQVDEKGKTKTTTVEFLVPAGETASYQSMGNELELKNGKTKGVVSVQVRVVSISAVDESGQQITTEIEEPSTTAVAYPTH